VAAVAEIIECMDYGPAPEPSGHVERWLAAHRDGLGHLIGGAFRQPMEERWFTVDNPATGATIARVAQGSAADIDAAVAAARAAFPAWSSLDGHRRARHLYAIARHIQKRARFFAVLETIDNGKPIRESRDIDIPLVARHFYHHAGWAELIESEFKGYRPLGVCGQIIPWNFPLLMLAWKIAPALAAGNTVVLKPAEFTPLTALAFGELCIEAGLPDGVVNIVTGDGATGAALVEHPDVDKIAFTGSTEVGRLIRRATAGSGKKLTLELGGKSPFIVFDDADLDAAVEGVVDAIWFNQGQVCCAGSRVLAQQAIAEKLTRKLKARMATLRVGDPLDKCTDVGAIVHPVQLDRIRNLVEVGRRAGGILHQADCQLPDTGTFFAPSLFLDIEPASPLFNVEIFGPVVTLTTFRTPDEAVELANNTRYGLAASIWSENINLSLDVASKVKAGVVWINATNVFDAGSGFGGYRESGFGREGGREGMHEYLASSPPAGRRSAHRETPRPPVAAPFRESRRSGRDEIDRTAKLYIGGRQVRPDSGYSFTCFDRRGRPVGIAGLGNRKDIRNAVEAAGGATGWGKATGHGRAQVLYYLAENLAARRREFAERLAILTGGQVTRTAREVDLAIRRAFWYAAQSDKYDSLVHSTQSNFVTLAMNEPWGVMGIACPTEAPLLGLLSLVLPAIAMGNRVVVIPSQNTPLIAADLYQVLDTSDVPAGVVNIVTGDREELSRTLAEHDDVACFWTAEGSAAAERASAGNLKVTWVDHGRSRDWFSEAEGQGREFLHRATQVKSIWVPYGE
jgi:aldehyde dehydrogenase (NAD+)